MPQSTTTSVTDPIHDGGGVRAMRALRYLCTLEIYNAIYHMIFPMCQRCKADIPLGIMR